MCVSVSVSMPHLHFTSMQLLKLLQPLVTVPSLNTRRASGIEKIVWYNRGTGGMAWNQGGLRVALSCFPLTLKCSPFSSLNEQMGQTHKTLAHHHCAQLALKYDEITVNHKAKIQILPNLPALVQSCQWDMHSMLWQGGSHGGLIKVKEHLFHYQGLNCSSTDIGTLDRTGP